MKANTSLRELAPAHPTRALVRRRPNVLFCMMAVMQKTHNMNQVVADVKPESASASEGTTPRRTRSMTPTSPTTPCGMVPQNHSATAASSTPMAMTPSWERPSNPGIAQEATTKTAANAAPITRLTGNAPFLNSWPADDATSWIPFGMASSPRGASDSKARTPAA